MNDIIEALKEVRKSQGLTQKDFADLIGLKQSAYAMIETGRNKPSLELLFKIVEVFKVDANLFFPHSGVTNIITKTRRFNDNVNDKSNDDLEQHNDEDSAKKTDRTSKKATKEDHASYSAKDLLNINKKVNAFYKRIAEKDPELDKAIGNLSELETVSHDLIRYIELLNEPVNNVFSTIITSDLKNVLSDTFITEGVDKLDILKSHNQNIADLVSSITQVLIFADNFETTSQKLQNITLPKQKKG